MNSHIEALRDRPIPTPTWLNQVRQQALRVGYDIAVAPGDQRCRFVLVVVPVGQCTAGPYELQQLIVSSIPKSGHFPPRCGRERVLSHTRWVWEVEIYGNEMYRFELWIYPSREPITQPARLK